MMNDKNLELHPIQVYGVKDAVCPTQVTLRVYEVYSHIFGKQEALITGWCRGGFSTGELIGFLYARSFPKDEWDYRFHEALKGLKVKC